MRDQTDIHNELVFEQEWLLHTAERELELAGNLFVFEDILSEERPNCFKNRSLAARSPPVYPCGYPGGAG